ncbi:MAG: hypothetical protein CMM01_18360 [Rhodopirellula sp.]|nr:hypothetical protein [Rhodopirellula sp.]OUX49983.1 MAG: hypothetical protein CBE43_08555 [Rhodopirellula sp. TMED283]
MCRIAQDQTGCRKIKLAYLQSRTNPMRPEALRCAALCTVLAKGSRTAYASKFLDDKQLGIQ